MLGASWKTTSAGITAIVMGVAMLYFAISNGALSAETLAAPLASILTGIGLLFARDNNVTSEQAMPKKLEEGK